MPTQAQSTSELLRARVERLHEREASTVRGVRLVQADAVAHFFQARNFTPGWSAAAIDQIVQTIRMIDLGRPRAG